MKADKEKLKAAREDELIKELNRIDEELSSQIHPVSWARCKELLEYKQEVQSELNTR